MNFRVELPIFRGPMDLLLYLVRKHEVEITEIPIAPITEQFLDYLTVLRELHVDQAGDFLDVASTLIEIKSRQVLPRGDEVEEPLPDPRGELVQRLLEYKKFKDAACLLEDRAREWQQHYPRLAEEYSTRPIDPADEPLASVELWDLVSAFGRILRERATVPTSRIRYDETPIHVYMGQIHAVLRERRRVKFSEFLRPDLHRSALVGIFLAVLELVRNYRIQVEQDQLFGEIELVASAELLAAPPSVEFGPILTYEHGPHGEMSGT
ncbi:MAG: segregation/condensation protein A [Pirellulales bacterium]|nr:segregation/condensation protein A [Pirellulales bacterium]